jgi:hypothetical protein
MVYPILGDFGRILSKSGRMPENSLNPAGIPAGFEIRCTPKIHDQIVTKANKMLV